MSIESQVYKGFQRFEDYIDYFQDMLYFYYYSQKYEKLKQLGEIKLDKDTQIILEYAKQKAEEFNDFVKKYLKLDVNVLDFIMEHIDEYFERRKLKNKDVELLIPSRIFDYIDELMTTLFLWQGSVYIGIDTFYFHLYRDFRTGKVRIAYRRAPSSLYDVIGYVVFYTSKFVFGLPLRNVIGSLLMSKLDILLSEHVHILINPYSYQPEGVTPLDYPLLVLIEPGLFNEFIDSIGIDEPVLDESVVKRIKKRIIEGKAIIRRHGGAVVLHFDKPLIIRGGEEIDKIRIPYYELTTNNLELLNELEEGTRIVFVASYDVIMIGSNKKIKLHDIVFKVINE